MRGAFNLDKPNLCWQVKVRSTGKAVVDRVRERLSFNDMQVGCKKANGRYMYQLTMPSFHAGYSQQRRLEERPE